MLSPTFLIAASITEDGWIELPAAGSGTAYPIARAYFAVDAEGGFAQCVVGGLEPDGDWRSLDMAYFARCLALELGPLTPDLFAIRGVGAVGTSCGRLAQADDASDEKRRQVLRGAFLVHLAAYESRLV